MKFFVSYLVVLIISLMSNVALAQSIDDYFYFTDDNSLSHRKATHVLLTPARINAGEAGTRDITASFYWHMFCHGTQTCAVKSGTTKVRNDIDAQIRIGLNLIGSRKNQIKMWSIVDEPYLKDIPKTDIEHAISRLYWISISSEFGYSNDIPMWVNFAHNCFKCSGSRSASCPVLTSQNCGMPGNAGRVSFDWYAASTEPTTCGDGTNNCRVANHINAKTVPTLNALKSYLYPYQDVSIFPGTFDGWGKMTGLGANFSLAKHVDIANADSRVKGVIPFTFKTPTSVTWKGVDEMDDGIEAERFYQAIAVSQVTSLKDMSVNPVFEYSDNVNFDVLGGGVSPANSHYYTIGYDTATHSISLGNFGYYGYGGSSELYQIRRLAFYMKKFQTGIYTQKLHRCVVFRPNFRKVVFFSLFSHCDGVSTAAQIGTGYVSPIKQGEAVHEILNCRSPQAPNWDQGHVMYLNSDGTKTSKCKATFGSQYFYFNTIGFSKAL